MHEYIPLQRPDLLETSAVQWADLVTNSKLEKLEKPNNSKEVSKYVGK